MNDQAVFAKTGAGQQEIAERTAGLNVRLRRMLILVDGRRNVAELRALSGSADAAGMLAELQQRGLIDAPGVAAGAPPAQAGPSAPSPAADDWRDQGRRAAQALNELLGPVGEGLAMQLEEVKSPDALDQLLSRGRTMVGELRGKGGLERFEKLLAG